MKGKNVFFTIVVALALFSLAMPVESQGEVYFPTTEWRTSTPEAQGMDSAQLASLFETYSQDYFNLDSLMVVRNGYVIAEAYKPPFEPDMKHLMYSASKTVIAALTGILLRDGQLESIDTPVLSLFPDRTVQNLDANKEAMTVRNLLTMSAGWECDEFGSEATTYAMVGSDDWLQFTLDLPMASTPGSEFHYCNGATYTLSAIVTELTGQSALDFAAEKLFAPLDITDFAWSSSPQGISYGYADLQLTTRDMAKIGYLLLHGGEWDGAQILPEEFVSEMMQPSIPTGWPDSSYGFQVWVTDSLQSYQGLGWGGQYILMFPNLDVVIVLTGGFSESVRVATHIYPLLYTFAGFTAADTALPENAEAQRVLTDIIAEIEHPTATAAKLPPEMAAQISDQDFALFSPFKMVALGAYGFLEGIDVNNVRFAFPDGDQATLTFTLGSGEAWSAPISMNNVYQVTPGPYGPIGIRGEWLDDNVFCLTMKDVGDATVDRMEFTFTPGAVQIYGAELVEGTTFAVQGLATSE